jgi:hypothetical protein
MAIDRAVRKKRGGSILGMDWEDNVRERIQKSRILNRLISYVNGEVSLEPAQVSAALGLLKKVLPDLSSSENKTQVTVHYVADVPQVAETTEQWQKDYPTLQ